jgi:BlaI family penicillinase repressor
MLLTDLQLAIMRVLWDRERASVADITSGLKPSRDLAPTTVATLLSRMEKRGIVDHDTAARQFIYYPKLTEPEVRRSMVSEMTERLFAGDVTALVSHLISAREFSRGDIAKVKAMLTDYESGKERKR